MSSPFAGLSYSYEEKTEIRIEEKMSEMVEKYKYKGIVGSRGMSDILEGKRRIEERKSKYEWIGNLYSGVNIYLYLKEGRYYIMNVRYGEVEAFNEIFI